MIERIHLEILRSTQQCGSLTAAAQKLCLTQSALSHSMKKLEDQLGAVWWQKEGRGLRLTRSGEYLLGIAERLLPQFEHAEQRVRQYAQGQRGTLRIGMECHPCYRWLLKVVAPYLTDWPDVDVDVKQQFQFGAIGALFNYEIDVLVTPDPLNKSGLLFKPVFDYEQVLVVAKNHPLAGQAYARAEQLSNQTLITHPVEHERLDIYQQFLLPAKCAPKAHKTIESTDIMLQMVANGRGVAALPRWLVNEYAQKIPLMSVSLGKHGIHKKSFLGIRAEDDPLEFVSAFFDCAHAV